MNVTLRQLKVFEAVARHGSFTRAAEELYLTQPAVSMQVKQLEENVGLALFEQSGKRFRLTEAGAALRNCSRAVARLLAETEDELAGLKGGDRGHLSLAVPGTANHLAMHLLAAFRARHPGIGFRVAVSNREGLLQRLEQSDCDLAIMGQPPDRSTLEAVRFMDNPLVVIAPPGHPLAGRARVPLARLRDEPFVMREPGSGTRTATERFFESQGWPLPTGMEAAGNEALKQAVEAGLGLGIVSQHTLAVELAAGRVALLDVQGFPVMRYWYIVQPRPKRLSPACAAFRAFVIDEAGEHWRLPGPPPA